MCEHGVRPCARAGVKRVGVVSLGLEGMTPDNVNYLAKSFSASLRGPTPGGVRGSATTASTPTGLERNRRALDELLRHGDSGSLQGLKNTVMTVLMVVSISEVRVEGIGVTATAAIGRQGTIAETRRRVRSLQAGQGADQWTSRTYNALRLACRDGHHLEHP